MNGFPLWGKLSPQVTDEGATSGYFSLIRRVPRHLPPKGKAFPGGVGLGWCKTEVIEVFRMKQKVPMICNIVSLILLIVFVIKSIVDYTQYSTSLNSAPFYLWVLVNALFLVIPAIILFVIGFVVKKKQ